MPGNENYNTLIRTAVSLEFFYMQTVIKSTNVFPRKKRKNCEKDFLE